MSKIIKSAPIKISLCGRKFTLNVAKVEDMNVVTLGGGRCKVNLTMTCDGIDICPDHSDFIEDAKALAAQYGLEIQEIKLKD